VAAVRRGLRRAFASAHAADRAGQPRERPAEDPDDGLAEGGADHGDAQEHDRGAHTDQAWPLAAAAGEAPGERGHTARHQGAPAGQPEPHGTGQEGDVVAHGRHRRDLRRPPGREVGRHRGDDHADDVGPDDGRGGEREPGRRQVDAEELEQRPEPQGQPATGGQADRGADESDADRLAEHQARHLPAARPDRAQQRQLAGALGDQHREGVEDDERADKYRHGGEDEQEDPEDVEEPPDLGPALVDRLLPRDGLVASGQDRGGLAAQLLLGHPVAGADQDRRVVARPHQEPLGDLGSEGREGDQRAQRARRPEREDAADPHGPGRALGQDLDPVADLEPALVSAPGVDDHLVGGAGRAPRHDPEGGVGVDSGVGGPVAADLRHGLAADDAAVLADDGRVALGGAVDVVGAWDLRSERGQHRLGDRAGRGILGRRERLLGADDELDVLVGLREQLVEAAGRGVLEDERARHERDPEDHRHGGQSQAQPVGGEAPQRELGRHRAAPPPGAGSSRPFMRSRTVAAVGAGSRPTMRPSARKTTSSA
jgi:hypothetical protein